MKTDQAIARWVIKEKDHGIDEDIIDSYLKQAYPKFWKKYQEEIEITKKLYQFDNWKVVK